MSGAGCRGGGAIARAPREWRDHIQPARVASHTTARPMLIHSHSEGARDGADDLAAAGTEECRDAEGVAVCGVMGAGGAAAVAGALPGAGRMVSVRPGRVATRGWLVCVSHQLTVRVAMV